MSTVDFTLNGVPARAEVPEDELLLDTLRDRFGLSGARYSCGIGVCGSCTVLLDGAAASSCLQLTQMVGGRRVATAESVLGADGSGRPVLDAFVEKRAFQCSYCIPAMALTVASLLEADPEATRESIREQLAGNLCRCGSYPQIVEAVADLVKVEGSR